MVAVVEHHAEQGYTKLPLRLRYVTEEKGGCAYVLKISRVEVCMLSTLKSNLKASLVSLILIFSLTEVSQAHLHHSYSHDRRHPPAHNPDWMSVLREDLRLSDLSIPGTHETMSRFAPPHQ